MNDNLNSEQPEFLTLSEIAKELRFSADTLRRHFIAGKLSDLEWVDFLGNGKLRASAKSVQEFKEKRIAATRRIHSKSF